MIVLMGEDTFLTFFPRKEKMDKVHGTIVGDHNGIPLIATYEMSWYREMSKYNTGDFRKHIQEEDWKFIKEQYDKKVL